MKRHTIETATLALKQKGLDSFLTIEAIDECGVVIKDKDYGIYRIELQVLAPSMDIPLHKLRKHYARVNAFKIKYGGKTVNGLLILDIFYGPDRGYKNRSFYAEYKGSCGHVGINTYSALAYHVKSFLCRTCSHTTHGERGKIDGILKKRTSTYIHWIQIHNTLPSKYSDFSVFKGEIGEKPFKRAAVVVVDGKLTWVNLQILEDIELNAIAMAVRQAFRNSSIFKNAIIQARIETNKGPRYQCGLCKLLYKRTEVQVDHIEPVIATDGSPLLKSTLIDRIWTDRIQVLDKQCHSKKSTAENKLRRESKKEKK